MGHRELLTALRRKGEEQAADIRQRAGAEEGEIRAGAAARGEELRQEYERRRSTGCRERRRAIVAEAEREASLVRLRAEHELALLLRELAGRCLAKLREGEYGTFLGELAAELPDTVWGTVRVNPLDADRAAALFPGAAISPDPAITGGLEAVSADGSLTVVNTLESRLDKGWPDLLPLLVAELREVTK